MKTPAIVLAALLAGSSLYAANVIEYTDRAAFLLQLQPGYYDENFSGLTPGDLGVTSLPLSGGLPTFNLTLETRNATDTFAGDNLYVADLGNLDHAPGTSTTLTNKLRLSSDGFRAIGGEWFLGDLDDNYVPGTVTLTFSDNTSFTVTSSGPENAFRGYISDTPLTSLYVSGPGTDYVTINHLVVGAVVPEPSTGLLAASALLLFGVRRRRAHT